MVDDDDDDHDDWCRIPQVMSENESMRVDDSRCDEAYVTVSSILATSYLMDDVVAPN